MSSSPPPVPAGKPTPLVSSHLVEFLLAEMCHYVTTSPSASDGEPQLQAEMAAAKLERMGSSVGYRLTEQLAISKTWTVPPNAADPTQATAAQQLEAVKFLCKEVWSQIFEKQIDKLQTNHRGVFVLKDSGVRWLNSMQSGSEHSRVTAMLLLAFPCGLIRGCLSALGIPAAVSCDFLADGQAMSSCSFNIKNNMMTLAAVPSLISLLLLPLIVCALDIGDVIWTITASGEVSYSTIRESGLSKTLERIRFIVCRRGPFFILQEDPRNGLYSATYQVDEKGREMLVSEARLAGQNGYCKTCTSYSGLSRSYRAEIVGVVASVGDGVYNSPHELEVLSVRTSNTLNAVCAAFETTPPLSSQPTSTPSDLPSDLPSMFPSDAPSLVPSTIPS